MDDIIGRIAARLRGARRRCAADLASDALLRAAGATRAGLEAEGGADPASAGEADGCGRRAVLVPALSPKMLPGDCTVHMTALGRRTPPERCECHIRCAALARALGYEPCSSYVKLRSGDVAYVAAPDSRVPSDAERLPRGVGWRLWRAEVL